jgi:hypothetical protein
MNQYRFALRIIATVGLVLGAVIYLVALFVGADDGVLTAGHVVADIIAAFIFIFGFFGLFFSLLAESIAHGQRALIQALQRTAEPTVPTVPAEPAAPDATEV